MLNCMQLNAKSVSSGRRELEAEINEDDQAMLMERCMPRTKPWRRGRREYP